MATFTAGDVREIVYQHDTLGEFRFSTKSNESYTIDFGGLRINDDANQITGNGQPIYQGNVVRWSFEGPLIANLITGRELLDLNRITESGKEGTLTITLATGAVYAAKGMPVGDIQIDTNNAQVSIKFSGGGTMALIP